MATFVLVHGGWHGGWCWSRVAGLLRSGGHTVFAPTLTGLGDRAHLFSGNITLTTHIDDIVRVLRWDDLQNVVLCGHSYAGFVISGVVELVPELIASLVYLDAFVPSDGESLFDAVSEQSRARHLASAGENGGLAIAPISAADFRTLEQNRAFIDSKCVPQPLGTFSEKLSLTGACDRVERKAYVRASGYPSVRFDLLYQKLSKRPDWSTYDMPSVGHDAMIDAPEAVADILQKQAAQQAGEKDTN